MKKKITKENKYYRKIKEIEKACNEEKAKIAAIGFPAIFITAAIFIAMFSIGDGKYAFIGLIGALTVPEIPAAIMTRKLRNINRYLSEQISLIEALQTKDELRNME